MSFTPHNGRMNIERPQCTIINGPSLGHSTTTPHLSPRHISLHENTVTERDDWTESEDRWTISTHMELQGCKGYVSGHADISFDTQCSIDVISTRLVAGLDASYKPMESRLIARTIAGETINAIGQVRARLWLKYTWSIFGWVLEGPPKLVELRLLVVESDLFDVFIGHPTLKKQRFLNHCSSWKGISGCLVLRNRPRKHAEPIIAPFRPVTQDTKVKAREKAAIKKSINDIREADQRRLEEREQANLSATQSERR